MIPNFENMRWRDGGRYWLANARTPACFLSDPSAIDADINADGEAHVDLLIEDGRLARIARHGVAEPTLAVDLGGRQVWPMLVDVHTHLDKGHTIERAPNVDGTFSTALQSTASDRPNWTTEDLLRRMTFGLRCAYAHGVSAIRTHLDSYPDQAARSWEVLQQVRSDWAGKLDLQAVSLVPLDYLMGEFGDRLAELVAASGGIFGGVTGPSLGDDAGSAYSLDDLLDRLFRLASRHDLDIDLHVDESSDPAVATLPSIARATVRHGYQGRVVCGHCCSLAVQPEDDAQRTLDLVAEAAISVVSLPTVNLYLQDRKNGRTPRWRGVTMVHEMRRRGIRVALAGDNCRDSFYAYGDHDVIDTLRQGVRILHLDHPALVAPSLVGPNAADMAGFDGHGRLTVGAPARLIVLNAVSLNQVLSRPQADRVIIDKGRRITERVPDYAELLAPDRVPAGA